MSGNKEEEPQFEIPKKHDVFVHYDRCDKCGQETMVIHYHYSRRPKHDIKLCTKCCPKTVAEGLNMKKGSYQVSLEEFKSISRCQPFEG